MRKRGIRKAIRYSIVLCLASWASALAFYLLVGSKPGFADRAADSLESILFLVFCTSYMFFPLVCAIILQLIDKEKLSSTGLLRFRINKHWIIGWLLIPCVIFLSVPVNGLFGPLGANFPPIPGMLESNALVLLITIVSGLIAGISINAVAAFGEEYGWRNYMLSALKDLKFWQAAIFIGLVWGFWHFPIILMGHNYPEHSVAGVFVMCGMTLPLSIIELYFVIKARSVFPAAIIHGTFNALAGVVSLFLPESNDLLNGMPGLAGIITLIFVCILIYLYDRYLSKDQLFSKTIAEGLDL